MPNKMCDEISYPFAHVNVCTIKTWEWISNFILLFISDVITYKFWGWSSPMLVKAVLYSKAAIKKEIDLFTGIANS